MLMQQSKAMIEKKTVAVKSVVILILSIHINSCYGIKSKQYGRFYRFDICKEAPDSPVKWEYITVDNSDSKISSINSKCVFSRDVKSARIAAVITRCAKKDNLDTCEPYGTIKPLDTCGFIAMKGMTWTTYIQSFKPPFTCPFKKGTYIQTNGTLDPEIFKFFPIHGWYWRVNFEIYEGEKFLFTQCTEFSVVKIN